MVMWRPWTHSQLARLHCRVVRDARREDIEDKPLQATIAWIHTALSSIFANVIVRVARSRNRQLPSTMYRTVLSIVPYDDIDETGSGRSMNTGSLPRPM